MLSENDTEIVRIKKCRSPVYSKGGTSGDRQNKL